MDPVKKSFILYYDQEAIVEQLNDEQSGKLLKLLYSNSHKKIEIKDPLIKLAYSVIKDQISRDHSKWLKKCQKNKENIKVRWAKDGIRPNTNVKERIRSHTNHTDTDTDTDI